MTAYPLEKETYTTTDVLKSKPSHQASVAYSVLSLYFMAEAFARLV